MLEFARMAKVGGDWWLGRNESVQSTPKPTLSLGSHIFGKREERVVIIHAPLATEE